MKLSAVKILILLAVTLVAPSVMAVDIYVDSGGSNTSPYDTWEKAATTIATAQSASSSGDVIYISGGASTKTYTGQIVGKAGVSFKAGALSASPSGHDGIVILAYVGNEGIYSNANNVVVDGYSSGTQKIRVTTSSSGVTITGAVTGNVLRGIEITGPTNGISINTGAVEISYCYIHDLALDSDRAIYANTPGGTAYGTISVHHNTIEAWNDPDRAGTGADGIQANANISIYNNTIRSIANVDYSEAQHNDAIQMGEGSYVKIYNNELSGWTSYGMYLEFSNDNVYIYNNYIWGSRNAIDCGGQDDRDNWYILNNTIADCINDTPVAGIRIYNANDTKVLSNFNIENNIIVNCPGAAISAADGNYTCGAHGSEVGMIVDYNVHVAGAAGSNSVVCDGGTYSQTHDGGTTQPTFVTYSAGGGAANDLSLAAGDMVAQNTGVSFSAVFTTDILGTTRSASWDIGAYEYYEQGSIHGITSMGVSKK